MKQDTINDTQESIKQMLVLTWLNANAQRRQDILTELERIAATQNIKLIQEVLGTIADMSVTEMAMDKYYSSRCQPSQSYFGVSHWKNREE